MWETKFLRINAINSDKHSFLRTVYGTNLGINVGELAHMRFLAVITCADICNERPTLGCERCAGCDKTTTIELEGM